MTKAVYRSGFFWWKTQNCQQHRVNPETSHAAVRHANYHTANTVIIETSS